MKEYKITDFGALSCDRLQTKEIQKAIDTCFLNGGGKVIVPKGIFLTGGIATTFKHNSVFRGRCNSSGKP